MRNLSHSNLSKLPKIMIVNKQQSWLINPGLVASKPLNHSAPLLSKGEESEKRV